MLLGGDSGRGDAPAGPLLCRARGTTLDLPPVLAGLCALDLPPLLPAGEAAPPTGYEALALVRSAAALRIDNTSW
jgi:hypothetical protein